MAYRVLFLIVLVGILQSATSDCNPNGQPCQAGCDCCSKYCVNNICQDKQHDCVTPKSTPAACKKDGVVCATDSECCSSYCDGALCADARKANCNKGHSDPCDASWQCCDRLYCVPDSKGRKKCNVNCIATEVKCDSDDECCPGSSCKGNTCKEDSTDKSSGKGPRLIAAGPCKTIGVPCQVDKDCCSKYCEDGLCADIRKKDCTKYGEDQCEASYECCNGLFCVPSGKGAWNGKKCGPCVDEGVCSGDDQCCGVTVCKGNRCRDPIVTPTTPTSTEAITTTKKPCTWNNYPCVENSDCCSNYCDTFSCTDPRKKDCTKGHEDNCRVSYDCCDNLYCVPNAKGIKRCTVNCIEEGKKCPKDDMCCRGTSCIKNKCQDTTKLVTTPKPTTIVAPCNPLGFYCDNDNQCCSKYCEGASCTDIKKKDCSKGNYTPCEASYECCDRMYCVPDQKGKKMCSYSCSEEADGCETDDECCLSPIKVFKCVDFKCTAQ